MNAIILMGTNIGNNSIVGAGSVVKGNFPDGSIIAGNPARVIGNYYQKNLNEWVSNAKRCAKRYTRILDIFQQLKRCPMDMHGCTWKEQKKT